MIEALSVATITILAVVSPGADFAMVTHNSMILSRRAGLLTAVGIAAGVWVHVCYSLLGIGLLISKSIILFNIVKWVGAAYLIFLGLGMLKSKKADSQVLPCSTRILSSWAAFKNGFFTNSLNPKTTLMVVALFSQVIDPATPITIQLGYGAFMSFAHLFWFGLIACAFSSNAAQVFVASCRYIIERAIGGVLVMLGIGLAASSLRRT